MSDGDITNLIRREIGRAMANLTHHRAGLISSYDGKGRVKVTYQPDGNESGWLPIGRHQGGKNIDVVHGPSVGDQVVVGFLDGDMESGFISHFLHSDVDVHPAVASGETLIQHKDKDGNVLMSHKVDATGNITITTKQKDVTINTQGGNLNYNTAGGNVTHATDGSYTLTVKGALNISAGSVAFTKA